MAKKVRSEPKVPRSNVGGRPVGVQETAGRAEDPTGAAPLRGPRNIAPEDFHRYVKSDLTRIAIFGTLIYLGMFILKVAVGL